MERPDDGEAGALKRSRLAALWIGAAALAAALALCQPIVSVAHFKRSALKGDYAQVARRSDFGAIRAHLRVAAHRRFLAAIEVHDELSHAPLAGLALVAGPEMAERYVSAVASPQGIAALLAVGEPPKTPIEAAFPPPPGERPALETRIGYQSWRRVRLGLRPKGAGLRRETGLIFVRQDLVRWTLVQVDPPS